MPVATATQSSDKLFDLWKWEVGKVYSLKSGSDTEIEGDGRAKINEFLVMRGLPHLIYDPWDWKATTEKGSFTKRYRKWLKQQYPDRYDLFDNDTAGALGSLINDYINRKVYFRFDNEFRWRDGMFGDAGSCYFQRGGCRSYMPRNLRSYGAYAIQFFRSATDLQSGYARALIIPYTPSEAVVINAYGMTLLQVSRIFAKAVGLSYQRVYCYNYENTEDLFWINQGLGYVIAEDVSPYDEDESIDFEWDIETYRCENCERIIQEDDETITVGGAEYCTACMRQCPDCDEWTPQGRLYQVYDANAQRRNVCTTCYNTNYHVCDCCGYTVPNAT